MAHSMQISRIGFFGAIMVYCPCGWTSGEIGGRKQSKKASKLYNKHLQNAKV